MRRAFAIILVLCLAALAVLELFGQSDVLATRVRGYAVDPRQEILGPAAQIGFVKVNFLPTLTRGGGNHSP